MYSYENVLQFAVWNKGIATSIPKEQLPCMNKTQEKKESNQFSWIFFLHEDRYNNSLSVVDFVLTKRKEWSLSVL